MTQYQGTVEAHNSLKDLIDSDENTKISIEIITDYWAYGYDEEVGRDTYLSNPNEAKNAAISRIHLRPINFTGKEKTEFGYTATESCWDNWKNNKRLPAREAASNNIPTSNDWIVYCVDHQRNICVLAYLPNPTNPHAFCERIDNMNLFIERANQWYGNNKTFPMGIKELPSVFDCKWLNKNIPDEQGEPMIVC